MKRIIASVAAIFSTATTVLAATGAREDNSGIFVWVFLGFCALIVALQLLPALVIVTQMVRVLIEKLTPHSRAH